MLKTIDKDRPALIAQNNQARSQFLMIKKHILKKYALFLFFGITGTLTAMEQATQTIPEVSAFDKAQGITPLHYAALLGLKHEVERLLSAGWDINAPTKEGVTPVIYAAHNGHSAVIELLINRGANKEAMTQHGTALHLAVRNKHEAAVETLLRMGANTEARDDQKLTPLNIGACLGSSAIVDLLIKNRPKKETLRVYGILPLCEAAGAGHLEVVKKLVSAGVSTEAHTILEGFTPLHAAARHGQIEVCKFLVRLLRKVPTKEEAKVVRARFRTALLCINRITNPMGNFSRELIEHILLDTSSLLDDATTVMLYDLNNGFAIKGSLLTHQLCREAAASVILKHSQGLLDDVHSAVKDSKETKDLFSSANRVRHILPLIKSGIEEQIDKITESVEMGKKPLQIQTCTQCNKTGNLSRCGRCKIVFYCSSDCQKKAWPEHSRICKKMSVAFVKERE